MVVKNNTKLDSNDALNTLIKITKKTYIPRFIITIIVLLSGLILTIMGCTTKYSDYFYPGLLFLLFGIIYLIVTILGLKRTPKKVLEVNKDLAEHGISYTYIFKEESFQFHARIENSVKKYKYSYKSVKKVFEYDDKYEIRLDHNEVLFVNKNGFENEKMIEFFIKNLSKNKIKIKKVK